jgi:enamine deaminase RidA (YjgF/YER057c/UK114 family)
MTIKHINPTGALKSIPRGYSHVVRADNVGSVVVVAGQGAVDENLKIVGGNSIEEQTRVTFRNIERNLKAAGADWKDVIKMNIFCSDVATQQWPIRNVRSEFIQVDNPPVSTMIQVSGFAIPGMLLEVDVYAVLPAKPARAAASAARKAVTKKSLAKKSAAKKPKRRATRRR